jgi:acetolactate synthase-1/2/3 large subunit
MTGKPAATLLHLGAGLANGLANLHNARRARTPIVNLIGGHASFHDPSGVSPLASDIEGFARPVSGWVHTTTGSMTAATDCARAVEAALGPPGQIATLIIPTDAAWADGGVPARALPQRHPAVVDQAVIDKVAAALGRPGKAAILMRGAALRERGLFAAGRIAAKTKALLLYDTLVPRIERGAGRVVAQRVPYFPDAAADFLREIRLLVLVGAAPPIPVFASPGRASWSAPDGCEILYLAHQHEDGITALEAVADTIDAPSEPTGRAKLALPELPVGEKLSPSTVARLVARLLPESAVLVDETVSSSQSLHPVLSGAPPHDHLAACGGSIGWALPAATGAAIACPGRKVICLHGDGGAVMAHAALWTQARENLDVTTVIFANRSYAILNIEMARAGFNDAGPLARSLFDLDRPQLDWVRLAEGMGVEASRAETVEAFADHFGSSLRTAGPRLIEAVI